MTLQVLPFKVTSPINYCYSQSAVMEGLFDSFLPPAPLPLPAPPNELIVRVPDVRLCPVYSLLKSNDIQRIHWAQRVFEGRLPSSRLKHQRVYVSLNGMFSVLERS